MRIGWCHGIAIANIRKENGLSQRQLVDLSGVKNSTISRIEVNKVNPDLETIEKLANALELEYLDFFATIYEKQISKELISNNEILNIQGNLDEGNVIYDISSGGTNAGLACTINLNGMDYQINGVGFNIVVYDKVTKSVVDSVCFYTAEDGPYCKR